MALFGPIFKALRGTRRAVKLPELIAAAEKEYETPLLETVTGSERFDLVVGLLDANLYQKIVQEGLPSREFRKKYVRMLKEEFRMAKEELQAEPANRAEVVALAIGLKEMAVNIDAQTSQIESTVTTNIKRRTEKQIKSLQNSTNTAVNGMGVRFKTLESQTMSEMGAIRQELEAAKKQQKLLWAMVFGLCIACALLTYQQIAPAPLDPVTEPPVEPEDVEPVDASTQEL